MKDSFLLQNLYLKTFMKKKAKKKVCRKLLYMLLWESLFIYMMEQSAN